MTKYIITGTERFSVEADSPEQALASWRVWFNGVSPELVGLTDDQVIDADAFEYLDGKGEINEAV